MGFPGGTSGKKKKIRLPMQEVQEMQVQSPSWEDTPEEETATHSILDLQMPEFKSQLLIHVVTWQKPTQHCKTILFHF